MNRSFRIAGAGFVALGAILVGALPSSAAPLYIGFSTNGGATITNEATSGTGSLTDSPGAIGIFNSVSATATGTPVFPAEPNLLSQTLDISSTGGTGSLKIYVTETNMFPLVPGFLSSFTSNTLASGWSVTEATYVNNCVPAGGACGVYPSGDVFNTSNLIASQTFTSIGTVVDGNGSPIVLTSDYAITEVFTITLTAAATGSANLTIDLSSTPVPAALPLFASGLGVLGLVARRRKQKKLAA